MKKDTLRTFALDSNVHNSLPVVRLRRKFGAEGFGVYIMLLCRLRTEPGCVSERDYESIAFSFGADPELIKHVVEDFGIFVVTVDGFYSQEIHRQRKIDLPAEKTPAEEPEEEAADVTPTTDQLIDELAQDEERMQYLVNTHYIVIQQLRLRLTGTYRCLCRQKNIRFDSLDALHRSFDQWLNSHR